MRNRWLALVLAITALPNALAEEAKVGDYTWTYAEEGCVWKIKSVSPASGDLVVPCTLGGKYISTINLHGLLRT